MTATVEILTGISGAGKTARCLDEYRAALKEAAENWRPGSTLWLSPTQRSANFIRRRLLESVGPVCFAPNVMNFDAFAERILKFSEKATTRLSPVSQRRLLKNVVAACLRENRLNYFAPIAETTGFLDLVAALISELKREETWPEDFEGALQAHGAAEKDRELALIYRRYQDFLLERNVYDAEGRFWSAREAIAGGSRRPFVDLSLVVVDGFSDFLHTQYEILGHLAAYAGRMLITLQTETPLKRSDLFDKTQTTRNGLEEFIGSLAGVKPQIVPLSPPADGNRPRSFAQIAEHLFDNPREIKPLPAADGIEIVKATGESGEARAVAERVKRLLLAGVPPEEILIAVRDTGDTAALYEEIFQAVGIPCHCASGRPLLRAPLVKAVFSLLQLEREDWPFAGLQSVLHSSFVRPGWDEWRRGEAGRKLLRCLRRLKLPSDREAMRKALRRAAGRDKDDDERSEAETALALLKRFARATAPLRKRADFPRWVDALLAVCRELGIARNKSDVAGESDDDVSRRERDTWDLFVRTLENAAHFERDFQEQPPELSLVEFQSQLRDLLEQQSLPPDGDEQGRVPIVDVNQVRNLEVPYLIVTGLTESSFPLSRHDDCLYGEAQRQRLNEHGLALKHRTAHSRDEMLLFYNVITRARRRLTLSYPAVHENGQPLYPSPYLAALCDLFDKNSLAESDETRFDPVPEPSRAMTAADFRLSATARTREHRPQLFRALLDHAATAEAGKNVLAAMDMAAARFQFAEPNPFDGQMQHEKHLAALRERFPAEYQFSATQLELYASCAFRFFVAEILKIEPLESPVSSTDYRSRGSLVHDVLATVHRELAEETKTPPGDTGEEIAERFRRRVDEQLGRRIDDSELQKALTRIEQSLLHEWAAAYGLQHEEYFAQFETSWDSPPVPHSFETAFGDVPGEEEEQTAAAYDSLSFGRGKRQTRVRGRIDRIDIGRVNDQPVFNVIDYKSGKPPRFSLDDVRSGRALQLVLYTLAVGRLDLLGTEAKPFLFGYWSLRETGFVAGIKGTRKKKHQPLDEAVFASLEEALEEVIPALAGDIRGGRFPVNSTDENCTAFCPYNMTCRIGQLRPLKEAFAARTRQPDNRPPEE